MKRLMKLFSLMITLSALFAGVGCHGQLPPTPAYETIWSWPAAVAASGWLGCGSGQPACTYVVSTLVLASGTTCPASTGSNYTPQQTATTGVSGTTWTQTGTSGETLCAVVQTVQSGNTSGSSPQSNAVVNPALPLAPAAPSGNAQAAALDKPAPVNALPPPSPQMAMAAPVQIVGHVVRVR
jgi:hypothetical protein